MKLINARLINILLFLGFVSTANASDYIGLQKKFDEYQKRLGDQTSMIQSDYNYLLSVVSTFPEKETSLKTRAGKLRYAAGQCRQSLTDRTLDVCTVKSRGRDISIAEAENLAGKCESTAEKCIVFKQEAELDLRTISDRLREIETLGVDLKQWKTENDAAVADQLKAMAGYLFGQLGEYLTDRAKAARILNKLVKQHKQELAAKGMNVPFMESRLLEVNSKFMRTKVTAMTGSALQQTDPLSLYATLENTILLVAQLESQFVLSVKELAQDPAMQELIQKEHVDLELANLLFQKDMEKFLGKKEIQSFLKLSKGSKIIPVMGIASLGIDTLYNGAKWWDSFDQIRMRYDLTEKSSNAATALHDLVSRRKTRWSQCLDF